MKAAAIRQRLHDPNKDDKSSLLLLNVLGRVEVLHVARRNTARDTREHRSQRDAPGRPTGTVEEAEAQQAGVAAFSEPPSTAHKTLRRPIKQGAGEQSERQQARVHNSTAHTNGHQASSWQIGSILH